MKERPRSVIDVCILVFGSKHLLATFLVAAPVLVLFLAIVAIFEMPLTEKGPLTPHSTSAIEAPQGGAMANPGSSYNAKRTLELAVRLALVSLVLTLLYIPIAWVFQFSRLSKLIFSKDNEPDEHRTIEARAEFLGWLTAISVPYLILGFSMTIEFHALIESPTKGVGAIAAIMVLYALSVLSSFLYIEVRELRQTFSREMRNTSEWMSYSFALGNYQTSFGSPAQKATLLLKTWIDLLGRGSAANTSVRRSIRQNLLGTFLTAYIKEESENICGDLEPDRMPIWVSAVKKAADGDSAAVAFIATNVGFYADYLSLAVKELANSIDRREQCVVLATVTYVLPPFWWNWPYASDHHGVYQPVEKFRKTLIKLAEDDAHNGQSIRVFRRMLVRAEESRAPEHETKLSDKTLRDVFLSTFSSALDWDRMKHWRIIKGSDGSPLTSSLAWSPVDTGQLVEPIRWTGGAMKDPKRGDDESHVYWMCGGVPAENISSEPLIDYYKSLMHPCGGNSEICSIDFDTFRKAFSLGGASGRGGLNGCAEITFIGTCDRNCGDAWNARPDFGLAFLSNMTKGYDSILLAVVTADALVESLWESVRETLNPTVIR